MTEYFYDSSQYRTGIIELLLILLFTRRCCNGNTLLRNGTEDWSVLKASFAIISRLVET